MKYKISHKVKLGKSASKDDGSWKAKVVVRFGRPFMTVVIKTNKWAPVLEKNVSETGEAKTRYLFRLAPQRWVTLTLKNDKWRLSQERNADQTKSNLEWPLLKRTPKYKYKFSKKDKPDLFFGKRFELDRLCVTFNKLLAHVTENCLNKHSSLAFKFMPIFKRTPLELLYVESVREKYEEIINRLVLAKQQKYAKKGWGKSKIDKKTKRYARKGWSKSKIDKKIKRYARKGWDKGKIDKKTKRYTRKLFGAYFDKLTDAKSYLDECVSLKLSEKEGFLLTPEEIKAFDESYARLEEFMNNLNGGTSSAGAASAASTSKKGAEKETSSPEIIAGVRVIRNEVEPAPNPMSENNPEAAEDKKPVTNPVAEDKNPVAETPKKEKKEKPVAEATADDISSAEETLIPVGGDEENKDAENKNELSRER